MARIGLWSQMRLDSGAPEYELLGEPARELSASSQLIFGAPRYLSGAPNDLNVRCSASYDQFSAAMLKNTEASQLPSTGG
jgi:hypothetical protein